MASKFWCGVCKNKKFVQKNMLWRFGNEKFIKFSTYRYLGASVGPAAGSVYSILFAL